MNIILNQDSHKITMTSLQKVVCHAEWNVVRTSRFDLMNIEKNRYKCVSFEEYKKKRHNSSQFYHSNTLKCVPVTYINRNGLGHNYWFASCLAQVDLFNHWLIVNDNIGISGTNIDGNEKKMGKWIWCQSFFLQDARCQPLCSSIHVY